VHVSEKRSDREKIDEGRPSPERSVGSMYSMGTSQHDPVHDAANHQLDNRIRAQFEMGAGNSSVRIRRMFSVHSSVAVREGWIIRVEAARGSASHHAAHDRPAYAAGEVKVKDRAPSGHEE